LEVQPGQGIYQWNDYNNDGLQQLNEFEVATFRDQARLFEFSFPQTIMCQLTPCKRIKPSVWSRPGGFHRKTGFSGVSYSGNWRLDRKLVVCQPYR
jgi:hypothetical protein